MIRQNSNLPTPTGARRCELFLIFIVRIHLRIQGDHDRLHADANQFVGVPPLAISIRRQSLGHAL